MCGRSVATTVSASFLQSFVFTITYEFLFFTPPSSWPSGSSRRADCLRYRCRSLQQPRKGWQLRQVLCYRAGTSIFVRLIAVDKVGIDGGCLAIQQRSMSALLISTSLSSTPVSEPSIPSWSTLVQMSCAHLRTNTRLRHGLLLHTLTDVTRVSLSQEHIDAGWSLGEAASRLHQRIDYCYYRLLKSGDSRGRQRSQDASDDAALEHTRVRASFLPARSRLVKLFSGHACHRSRGPTFRGCWRGRPAQARSVELSAARAHAIASDLLAAQDVAHSVVGLWSVAGVLSARAETARVAGRWVEVTRTVHSRLGVACVLA